MSTRCQVKIEGVDLEKGEAITLYHHCDGYPSNMVPLLARAYKPDWQHGRVGKAASFVIALEPDQFEPEAGHDLHGDIEWYYIIRVSSKGHTADVPKWTLSVYKCTGDTLDEFTLVYNGLIQKAVELADSMEETEE
jgi:hypothetical protein